MVAVLNVLLSMTLAETLAVEALVSVAFKKDSGVVDRGADSGGEHCDGGDDGSCDTGECYKGGKRLRILKVIKALWSLWMTSMVGFTFSFDDRYSND